MFLDVLVIGRSDFCKFEVADFYEGKVVFKCHNFSLCLVREDLQNSDEHIAFIDRAMFC